MEKTKEEYKKIKFERRRFGEHLTPFELFKKYILPDIKDKIWHYTWIDLYAGAGNLILPILELIPEKDRPIFFEGHIRLFDIQPKMVEIARLKAVEYGIPNHLTEKFIKCQDTLIDYPEELNNLQYPAFHITNPPYLYIGYIVKHNDTKNYLKYFSGINNGYQDLYQIALINDLRHNIQNMVYIIPSNFLYGASVSNKIRDDIFEFYRIRKAYIFEKKIFEFTGANVALCFFERKDMPKKEILKFVGTKINQSEYKRKYILRPENHFRAGGEFYSFVENFTAKKPLKVKFYLTLQDVQENQGNNELKVIDVNNFQGGQYTVTKVTVNKYLSERVKNNKLFVRTIDTGNNNGRAGLYFINEVFGVDGILVSKSKYRTHPIQLFLEPQLSHEEQNLLKEYFNLLLEYFRIESDSEFMTTYKYSNSEYTRKYLGLSQVKKLIETFPILTLNENEIDTLKVLVKDKLINELIAFIDSRSAKNK